MARRISPTGRRMTWSARTRPSLSSLPAAPHSLRVVFLGLLLTTSACVVQEGAAQTEQPFRSATESDQGEKATSERANRLANETSPYLLLHAHNPVDWYPWGPEAFERARAENKPIFLSIGYSSCYWCHVMERLVFSNEEIAEYMNEHFINIKVDREERPDLDDLYMLSLQVYFQLAGSAQGGGWPLSMFLTPDGKPIAGGTYFPPEDAHGRLGFPTVMRHVMNAWETRREDVVRTADLVAREVRRLSLPGAQLSSVSLSQELVDHAVDAVLVAYDPEHGGFDFNPDEPDGPKFPVPSRLMLLQRRLAQKAVPDVARKLDHTLDEMAAGGIYDHLGGGFHRYSTDREWHVPHFEKMLYDNAQLASVYAEAFLRTSRKPYRQVATGILDFVLRDLRSPDGAFYSALDAETDGVEGAFYVWQPREIEEHVSAANTELFLDAYGLARPSPFELGYVLHHPEPLSVVAERHEMPLSELQSRLAEAREKLLAVRRERTALLRDDKILTSWNGLMIAALARAGAILDRREYLNAAEKAAIYVLSHMRNADGRLLRTSRLGAARLNAYLDDYAFLVDGLLALYDATREDKWLNAAQRLTDDQLELFWDRERNGFFFTTHDHEQLLARQKTAYDSALPSGNSVSVRNLVRLAKLTGQPRYLEPAQKTLELFAPQLEQTPGSVPYLALALIDYLAVVGEAGTGGVSGGIFAGPTPRMEPGTTKPGEPARPRSPAEPVAPEKLVPAAEMAVADVAQHDKVRATVYFSKPQWVAGETVRVAVTIDVREGWHINANPARPDFVIPTKLTAKLPSGATLGEVNYPKGMDFKLEGIDEPLSVYEGRIVLTGSITVPATATGEEAFEFRLRYQACNNVNCLRPMNLVLKGKVPIAATGTKVPAINTQLFDDQP